MTTALALIVLAFYVAGSIGAVAGTRQRARFRALDGLVRVASLTTVALLWPFLMFGAWIFALNGVDLEDAHGVRRHGSP